MLMPAENEGFKISVESENVFRVEVFLDENISEYEQLPQILKNLKERISQQFGVPVNQLRYKQILEKRVTPDGFIITLEIERATIFSGKPVLKIYNATMPNGQSIENMILMVDIFPFDDNNRPITEEAVLRLILDSKIKEQFIDKNILKKAIEGISNRIMPLEDVLLAKGIFPEVGIDARLDFNFKLKPDEKGVREYLSSRRAKKGDLLCRKHSRTMGKKSGYNLFGEEILPIPGRDFILQAGNGTRLSPDRMKIFADAEGAIVVRKEETKVSTMGYTEAFPREVHLRIDPLVVVEALRTVEIVTKNSVEVKGDLHPNSNIVSDGEVYVAGDVGANTKIHAQDDIIIQGNVEQGTVISSKNIFTGGAVSLSTLSAKGSVKVEGLIKNSQVWGQEVEVERLNNSTVVAEKRAIIRSVESDEANILSEIRVGVKAYNQMRINENNEFILFLRGDLRKLRDLFGKEVVEDTTYSNTELMFLKFVKLYGRTKALKETKLESLREVFDSIPSVKIMINEKNKENEKLKVEMSKEKKVPGSVIIYEKIESPVLIQINSSKTEFAPGEGGKFALKEGQVVKEELDQEWQKLEEGKR